MCTINITDPQLVAAVEEISEDLEADGVRVLVFGKSDKYDNLEDIVDECGSSMPHCPARRGDRFSIESRLIPYFAHR